MLSSLPYTPEQTCYNPLTHPLHKPLQHCKPFFACLFRTNPVTPWFDECLISIHHSPLSTGGAPGKQQRLEENAPWVWGSCCSCCKRALYDRARQPSYTTDGMQSWRADDQIFSRCRKSKRSTTPYPYLVLVRLREGWTGTTKKKPLKRPQSTEHARAAKLTTCVRSSDPFMVPEGRRINLSSVAMCRSGRAIRG